MDRFVMTTHSLKNTLYVTIFGTHTKAGRAFDIALIIAIISSLAVLVLDSIPSVRAEWAKELKYLEYTFTGLFTIEYLLRLYCSPKPVAYAKKFLRYCRPVGDYPNLLSIVLPIRLFHGRDQSTTCDAYFSYLEVGEVPARVEHFVALITNGSQKDLHLLHNRRHFGHDFRFIDFYC